MPPRVPGSEQGRNRPGQRPNRLRPAVLISIAALAVVAYALANLAHEGAHGLACIAVGGRPVALSAIYFDCDKTGIRSGARLIPAAGSVANLVLAAGALVALVALRRGPWRGSGSLRYFAW